LVFKADKKMMFLPRLPRGLWGDWQPR
jgi:hypothetical protein